MDERRKLKIIFLDFDGVINGSGPIRYIIWKISKYLHMEKLYKFIYKEDVYGVHRAKVRRLSWICNITGAYIVFSSSWRNIAYKCINEEIYNDEYNASRLAKLFKEYKIPVLGKTKDLYPYKRQDEIISWLSKNENRVDKFIILDDEWSHLKVFIDGELILTSDAHPGKPILGYWYCRDGIRLKHVFKAIRKLGINKYKYTF